MPSIVDIAAIMLIEVTLDAPEALMPASLLLHYAHAEQRDDITCQR